MMQDNQTVDFVLYRNSHERLCLRQADGAVHEGVTPVRAFPIAAPQEAISLLGSDSKEVAWLAHMSHLDAAQQALLEADLAVREFVPEIAAIEAIDSISVPSQWTVRTDRGMATVWLKAEEDIRKLDHGRHLLITSREGVQYRIRDTLQLDRHSQKLLERFL